MIHFQFLYYLVVLLAGWTTLTGAWRAWRHSRKRAALYFILVILSFWLIQLELTLQLYGLILRDGPPLIRIWQGLTDTAAVALLFVSLPLLAKTSLGIAPGRSDRIISLATVILLFILKSLYARDESRMIRLLGIALIYAVLFRTGFLLFRYGSNLGSRELRRYLRLTGRTSLIALPFLLLEHLRPLIPVLTPLTGVEALALPSFFLALNLEALLYGRPFFDRPSSLSREDRFARFCEEYGLTKREREVARLYARGETFARVAEELFISPKTVDKHVENIYAKTGVRSQAQFIHMVIGGI